MIDSDALQANIAPRVARAVGPGRCWNSSATGGPPTAVAVPNTFETTPATSAVARVIGTGGAMTLSSTPASTVHATITVSVFTSAISRITSPTAVPGTAPASIQGSATRSRCACSRSSVVIASGIATSTNVAGSASGTV